MVATSSHVNKTSKILQRIRTDYSSVAFIEADNYHWDPVASTIFYVACNKQSDLWPLLHELGHMQAEHKTYKSDVQLLGMELEAWKIARSLAEHYQILIKQSYVEDCMDSYRDWLNKRSSCPKCHQNGIQKNDTTYSCVNCSEEWLVSSSRFCRVYRKTSTL